MKHWALCAIGLAMLSPGVARAATPERGARVVIDRVVAVVDGQPILLSTLRRRAAPFIHASRGVPGYHRQQALRRVYRELMRRLVDERLVECAARDAGFSVDRATVNAAIDAVEKQNHMKHADLLRALRGAGMNEKEYRAVIRRHLLERELLDAYIQKDGVRLDGKDEKEQTRIMERERKRWMADLRRHASIQQYFQP